jgi:glycosyltransferase involved in cell wall biosynthesis
LIDELTKLNVKAYCVGMKSKFDIMAIRRLSDIIKESRADVLHTYLFHANILGRIIGRINRVPVIISSERCLDLERRGFNNLLNNLTLRWCSKIVVVSDSVGKMLMARDKVPCSRIVRIYSGIEFSNYDLNIDKDSNRKELGLKSDDVVIGTIGRLRPEKGHEYLIKAIAEVLRKFPEVRLLIAGDGAEENKLKCLSDKMGIKDKVIFTGFRNDIPEILSILDLFVLPSIEEGLPMAVLEAMASGRGIVATRIGGTEELIQDGVTGVLVPPKDVHALAGAIYGLLKEHDKINRFGMLAREAAKNNFSINNMLKNYERLYEELVLPPQAA